VGGGCESDEPSNQSSGNIISQIIFEICHHKNIFGVEYLPRFSQENCGTIHFLSTHSLGFILRLIYFTLLPSGPSPNDPHFPDRVAARSELGAHEAHLFPHAVLEIKLAGPEPPWVVDLKAKWAVSLVQVRSRVLAVAQFYLCSAEGPVLTLSPSCSFQWQGFQATIFLYSLFKISLILNTNFHIARCLRRSCIIDSPCSPHSPCLQLPPSHTLSAHWPAHPRPRQVYKFSKFLSSIALFHLPHVRGVPHWFKADGTMDTQLVDANLTVTGGLVTLVRADLLEFSRGDGEREWEGEGEGGSE
jgi:hypothetical protein